MSTSISPKIRMHAHLNTAAIEKIFDILSEAKPSPTRRRPRQNLSIAAL
jgi:hypothetical protein